MKAKRNFQTAALNAVEPPRFRGEVPPGRPATHVVWEAYPDGSAIVHRFDDEDLAMQCAVALGTTVDLLTYPLKPIADKLGITEPLYDNNTNTGLLWEYGPHGSGLIYAKG